MTGFNLPGGVKVKLPAAANGEVDVPLDAQEVSLRRKPLKVAVGNAGRIARSRAERRCRPQATPITVPARSAGGFAPPKPAHEDDDYFRFESKAGQTWIVETDAARRGSPVDTVIEVLHGRRQADRAGAAAGGARFERHLPRHRRQHARLPADELGRDAVEPVGLPQRRGGQAVSLAARTRLGLFVLRGGRRQAAVLLRHHRHGARRRRAVPSSSSRTRRARSWSPAACRSFRSTTPTTTTASGGWAATRD